MTEIIIENAGLRYNRDWIFRGINYHFVSGKHYAVTGTNGSGKSTFLQALCGALDIKEGKRTWKQQEDVIAAEKYFRYFAIAAPYLDLVEEFSAAEFLTFHSQFKKMISGVSVSDILEIVQLGAAENKQIRYFSSGMKQRLKLAQAIFSDVDVLFLDEPCTNLDAEGYALYQRLIKDYCHERLLIVASNDTKEYGFCSEIININQYK